MDSQQFMTNELIQRIRHRLSEIRSEAAATPEKNWSPMVFYLRGALDVVADLEMRGYLLTLMAGEYGLLGRGEEEERVMRESIALEPDEPLPHIVLASFLSTQPGRLDEARSEAKAAVAFSESRHRFRRHSLQTLARVLKLRGEYGDMAEVLRALAHLHVGANEADSAREQDFLINLPEGVVDLATLKELTGRQGKS